MIKLIAAELPRRVSHHYRQHYRHGCEQVWPQLCPVAEQHWIPGWAPAVIFSQRNGIESECIFVTPGELGDAIWITSHYDASAYALNLYKITPGVTVAKIDIRLHQDDGGCIADITYTHTSLGALGDRFLQTFTPEHFAQFMQTWQQQLDHYLTHTDTRNEKSP